MAWSHLCWCEGHSGSAVPPHDAAGMVFSLSGGLRRNFCYDLNLIFQAHTWFPAVVLFLGGHVLTLGPTLVVDFWAVRSSGRK